MSAKKSWDVHVKRRPAPKRAEQVQVRLPRRSGGRTDVPLKERRRKARRLTSTLIVFFILASIGAIGYALNQPFLRVHEVTASGPHAEAIPALVKSGLGGSYLGFLPNDSIVWFSKDRLRTAILSAYPDLSAVAIERAGLSAISVTTIGRISVYSWCGEAGDMIDGTCYIADGDGYIYAPATEATSTLLRVFAPLSTPATDSPVGRTIKDASRLPVAFQFVEAVQSFNLKAESFVMRGDEGDILLRGGTRITYIIGDEKQALALLAAVVPGLSLSDGSIEYLDVRFSGKAYVKRRGVEASEPAL